MTIHLGSLIACFVICALLYWAVTMLIKQQPFRNVALVVIVVVFVVWLLAALGIWNPGLRFS